MKARIQASYKIDMSPEEFIAQTEMLGRAVEAAAGAVGRRGDSGINPSVLADFMELAHRVVDRLEPARSPFTMPDPPPPPPFRGEDESEGEEPEEGEDGEDNGGEDNGGEQDWTIPKWNT